MHNQVLVSPGFAIAVHSVQGKEEDPLIVDVCISASNSRHTCHVALSRGKTWHGIHILRPFPLETFQGRAPLGPLVLSKRLQREEIDWEAVAQEMSERALATKKTERKRRMPGVLRLRCRAAVGIAFREPT